MSRNVDHLCVYLCNFKCDQSIPTTESQLFLNEGATLASSTVGLQFPFSRPIKLCVTFAALALECLIVVFFSKGYN